MKPVLAWHFLTDSYIPGWGRRNKPLYVGHLWRMKGPIEICKRGLHGSIQAGDALRYACGPIITRTEHSGTVVHGKDKLASTRRKILGMADASTTLHEFACDIATRVLHLEGVTDERYWDAIETRRKWIRGEATKNDMYHARCALRDSAHSPHQDAVWGVAMIVLGHNPLNAAWDIFGKIYENPTWYFSKDLSWDALNADLESRLLCLLGMEDVE